MRYFVDKRIMTLVSEDDLDIKFLAPETFYEYGSSIDDTVRETWYVDKGKAIDFTYSREEMSSNLLKIMRNAHFKTHCAEPLYLKAYFVPKDLFEKTVIESGYEI